MSALETYATVGTNNVSCALYGNYLYTVNYTASKIVRVNLTNSTDISLNWATSTQGINTPFGIAIDSSNGYIYSCNITASSYISKISLVNPTTTFTPNWLSFPAGYLSTAAIVIENYIYVSYTNDVNGGGNVNYINKYSLTDPVNDKVIAWATTSNVVDSFLFYNNYLYVGVRYTGVYKISITNPGTENTLYTNLTGAGNSIFGLARFGNYLYVSLEQGSTIMRISLTNTTDYNLLYVKDTTNLNYVCGIAAYGNYLYAVSYSVTNITRKLINDYVPSIYKNLTLNSNRAVVKSGKYLYIANYTANSIIRASLTDSADISLNWATSTQGISNPGAIVLYDNYIYVVNKGTARNSIPKISITNPTTDFNTAWKTISIDSGGNTFYADGATALNGYLYVSYGNQNSTVFKISRVSFANPTGDYVADWYIPNVHYYTIFGYNNILYAGAYNQGIRKLSPTDPSNNNTLWANSYVLSNSSGLISGMDVQGDYLYVSLTQQNAIARVSISNPTSVNTIVEYSKDGTNLNGVFGIATRGTWLYAVNYNNTSLVRIPIGTDNTVAYKYLYAPSLMIRQNVGIDQDGTYMYIPSEANNVIVRLHMTNPADVSYSWATTTQGVTAPYSVSVFNGNVYCMNRGANNQVISRISTSNPTGNYTSNWRTTTVGSGYFALSSRIVSGYLYVSYSNGSARAISKISVTNPGGDYTPNWVNPTGDVQSMISYNGYLYCGIGSTGIFRYNLTNPSGDKGVWSNIGLLATSALYGLAIQGTNLFVSLQSNNMIYRLDLNNPTGNTYTPEFASVNDTSISNSICGITINGNYIYSVNYNNSTVTRTIIDPSFVVIPRAPPIYNVVLVGSGNIKVIVGESVPLPTYDTYYLSNISYFAYLYSGGTNQSGNISYYTTNAGVLSPTNTTYGNVETYISGLSANTYTVYLVATNLAGNSTPISANINVYTTPISPSIDTVNTQSLTSGNLTVFITDTVNSPTNGIYYLYSMDRITYGNSGVVKTGNTTYSFTINNTGNAQIPLIAKTYTLYIAAANPIGNTTSTPATATEIVYTTPSPPTINQGNTKSITSGNLNVGFTDTFNNGNNQVEYTYFLYDSTAPSLFYV